VLWMGVDAGADHLIAIEGIVSERLKSIGIAAEERPYTPHLTLARVRDAAGLRTTTIFDGLSPRLGETRVDAITLFESRLSPKGPTYVALERTALKHS
jgi:RNA 2',3'-cyclic 3'-phosphodiesterase